MAEVSSRLGFVESTEGAGWEGFGRTKNKQAAVSLSHSHKRPCHCHIHTEAVTQQQHSEVRQEDVHHAAFRREIKDRKNSLQKQTVKH